MVKKFEPCSDCLKSKNPGYTKDENGVVRECDCLKKYNKYISFITYLQSINVPNPYFDYDISSYIGKSAIKNFSIILSSIESFCENGFNAYFSGEPGTQKTSVAIYLIKKALVKKINCYYLTMSELLSKIRKEYKPKLEDYNENLELVDRLLNYKLLVIDDAFDKNKILLIKNREEDQINLYTFLKKRMDNNNSNLYISNIPRVEIDYTLFNPYISDILNKKCKEIFFNDAVPSELSNKKIMSFFSEKVKNGKEEKTK